jgi:hypothetical protein
MIAYHGTPISGSRIDAQRFLKGRHALVPFPRPDDMPIVADCCSSFVLDNGAFSIWKKGGRLDVHGYIEWVIKWHLHPGYDWAIIPDVIGGTELENDCLLEIWPKEIKGVPVYHINESIGRLIKLSNSYEMIALGSSALYTTHQSFWRRMEVVMDAICDDMGRPICKIHGLRMLDPRLFTKLPLASADSTNATRNSNNFRIINSPYPQPTTAQRADNIANTIEAHNSAACWKRTLQAELF